MKVSQKNIWLEIIGWLILAIILLGVIPLLYPVDLPLFYHLYHFILFFVLLAAYYLNTLVIIPKVVTNKINITYLISLIGLFVVIVIIMNTIENVLEVRKLVYNSIYPNSQYIAKDHKSYINYYLLLLTGIIFGVGYLNHLYKRWNLEKQKNQKLQDSKIKAELDSLKAQIHPHFFFNSLNTIYALTYIDVAQSQQALVSLSKMMRYVLNKENTQYVTLQEETLFISNYLELIKHRLSFNVSTNFSLTSENGKVKIIPMVLLTFVENCFKHGISNDKECCVKIATYFQQDYFVLHTQNNWFAALQDNKSTGIGINNTKKRLDIAYKDAYELKTWTENDQYHCVLKIKLL
ncbi:sensor histidine kinase [Myroides sp. LJL110]